MATILEPVQSLSYSAVSKKSNTKIYLESLTLEGKTRLVGSVTPHLNVER